MHVETKHKGHVQVQLISYGSNSHASRSWQGDNAITKLIRQYERLVNSIPTATKKNKWLPSINPTAVFSGGAYNVTPSKAEMVLDVRTTEDLTNKQFFSLLNSQNLKYKQLITGAMMLTDKKNPYVKSLKKIAQKVQNKKIKYIKSCGGSDGRFFSNKGIPVVNFGPIGKNHHRGNEYVEVKSLIEYYTVLEVFIITHISNKN